MDLGPTEMALSTLYHQLQLFRSLRVFAIGATKMACQLSVALLLHFGPTEMMQSVPPKWGFALPLHIGRSEMFPFGPTGTSKFISFALVGLTENSSRCHRVWSKVCNGWISCGGYIYPSAPLLPSKRAIKTCLHFHHTFSEREPPTHVLRSSYFNPTIWTMISSLPKLLSSQILLPSNPNLWGDVWVLGRLSLEAQE